MLNLYVGGKQLVSWISTPDTGNTILVKYCNKIQDTFCLKNDGSILIAKINIKTQ